MLSHTVTGRREIRISYCRYCTAILNLEGRTYFQAYHYPHTMRGSIVVATILLAGGALADTPAQRAAALLAQMNITEKVRVVPVGGACRLGLGPAAAPTSRSCLQPSFARSRPVADWAVVGRRQRGGTGAPAVYPWKFVDMSHAGSSRRCRCPGSGVRAERP